MNPDDPLILPGLDNGEVRFYCGSSNRPLAEAIAAQLGVTLEETLIRRFSNDNLYIQLGASVRSRQVFILQSLSPPVNDHLMELLMMLDIARAAAAKDVHAIIPFFSFARSDKKDAARISITARLVADLLQTAGATHIMTMNLHSPQVHGFFGVPADPLTARPVFVRYFREKALREAIVVTPDAGQAKSAARFADQIGLRMTTGSKERVSDTVVHIDTLVGKTVQGFKRVIIFDDEIATGSSVLELSRILVDNGVEEIYVACTHGLFAGPALERLDAEPAIKEVVTTDTVMIAPDKLRPKLRVLSAAGIFAEAIRRNYHRQSIGDLFAYGDI